MVTTGALVRQVAALHEAIDRLSSCLPSRGHTASRELTEIAAQDVLRAWVQARRRTLELDRQITGQAAAALGWAERALDGQPASLGASVSPLRGEVDGGAAGAPVGDPRASMSSRLRWLGHGARAIVVWIEMCGQDRAPGASRWRRRAHGAVALAMSPVADRFDEWIALPLTAMCRRVVREVNARVAKHEGQAR